jgi:hypothetical protein
MIKYEGDVYCEQHGCIHEAVTNPYDGCPTERDENGNPVWLEYVGLDKDGEPVEHSSWNSKVVKTVTRPMAPDCTPDCWRNLWIGARYKNKS